MPGPVSGAMGSGCSNGYSVGGAGGTGAGRGEGAGLTRNHCVFVFVCVCLCVCFTARRYASAVLAVIVCLSVCLSQVGVVQRWLNLGSD